MINAYAFFVKYILGNLSILQQCNKEEDIFCPIAKQENWKYSNQHKLWIDLLFLYYPPKLKELCIKIESDPFAFFIHEFLNLPFLKKFLMNVPRKLESYFADILYMAKYGANFTYYIVPENKKTKALKAIKLFFKKAKMDDELRSKLKFKIRSPQEMVRILDPNQKLYELDLQIGDRTFIGVEKVKSEIKHPFVDSLFSICRRINEIHGKYRTESNILKKCPDKPMFFLMTPPVYVEILDYMALHGKFHGH